MKRSLVLLLVLALLAGPLAACVKRVAVYSPRRTPTPEHVEARSNTECLGCHDIAARKTHSPTDNCLQCHILCKGC